ncbi:MAG: hypothetical protein ACOYOI_05215 [Chthoniobacterales bacterium]
MNKTALALSILLIAGCAAPPPVRIASSILGRSVFKKAKEDYQQNHPKTSPTPTPSPMPQS